jgi:hypothetical protein
VLSLGAKPRGLKPGNNILILFQKICASYVFILSSFGRMHDFPSGGRNACWWNACSSMGDKCQPWCMRIKWPG